MTINLQKPDITELKPRITVFGVGGGGGNAVNNMITAGLRGVEFVVANTDAQALTMSKADRLIQLGAHVTEGLGAGSQPEVGRAAAEECIDEIIDHLSNTHMCFVTAGMGGGTGTGAAPVVARAAREKGILTVGVVTKPFHFEGQRRMKTADLGIEELQKCVDTLIVIPNQNLFRLANDKTTFADAFAMADQVLYSGVACITDLMVKEGLINLDFADVRSVMREMGKAMMGTGEASGEGRAMAAAEAAIANPLLDETSMKGAKGLLISITGGRDLTLFEVDEAATRIREEVDQDANIILGATFDEELEGVIRVSVVATGIDKSAAEIAAANGWGGALPAALQSPEHSISTDRSVCLFEDLCYAATGRRIPRRCTGRQTKAQRWQRTLVGEITVKMDNLAEFESLLERSYFPYRIDELHERAVRRSTFSPFRWPADCLGSRGTPSTRDSVATMCFISLKPVNSKLSKGHRPSKWKLRKIRAVFGHAPGPNSPAWTGEVLGAQHSGDHLSTVSESLAGILHTPISFRTGVGAILYALLDTVSQQRETIAESNSAILNRSIIDFTTSLLFEAAIGGAGSASSVDRHYSRILECIHKHLDNRALSIDFVAARLGISRSYLCMIISTQGKRFERIVMELRLERARSILCDQVGLSMAETAERAGFASASHYSRRLEQGIRHAADRIQKALPQLIPDKAQNRHRLRWPPYRCNRHQPALRQPPAGQRVRATDLHEVPFRLPERTG